jgi:hypothetical protein
MAGFWCLHGNWRENGYRYFPDPDVVYLYLISHTGFTGDYLYGNGFPDEHEALYSCSQAESVEESLRFLVSCFWFLV